MHKIDSLKKYDCFIFLHKTSALLNVFLQNRSKVSWHSILDPGENQVESWDSILDCCVSILDSCKIGQTGTALVYKRL